MRNDDTVFALSTPVGGAITVMRISGGNSLALLSRVFTGKPSHRRVAYGRITDEDGNTVDTCCAVYFAAPSSYTGEDMAEISVHGSYAVAVKLTELIERTGLARKAEPGEFTKRAFLNGKMDLAEAEAVMDLISSTAERSRRAAAAQMEGALSAVVGRIYESAKTEAARAANAMDDETGEAGIDTEAAAETLRALSDEAAALAENGLKSRILREGARVALIGSPNVGKSSLLNALILRDRAIVTAVPGTTRDTVEESASVEGLPVVFIDTAGIREAADEVEAMGVMRSVRERDGADLVLWLIDGTREPNAADYNAAEGVDPRKTLVVITKSDLETVIFPDADGRFEALPAFSVSSVTGDGLTSLKKGVANALMPSSDSRLDTEPIVTNSRHAEALFKASEKLSDAALAVRDDDLDAEFHSLRGAMGDLASILGRDDPDEELVNEIFSRFCLGK